MNIDKITKNIHRHLVKRAINGDMDGVDMNGFDMEPIKQIITKALKQDEEKNPTAFGFDMYDVIEHGKENGYRVSKKRAREIIGRMNSKGDVSIGISWDTVLFFIEESFGRWD